MDESRNLMKRTKSRGKCNVSFLLRDLRKADVSQTSSLVLKSTEDIPVTGSTNSISIDSADLSVRRNELFNLVCLAQKESNLSSSPTSREPASKRRSPPELHNEGPGLKAISVIEASDGKAECTETNADDLPDPSIDTSPDEYLLLLTKAQFGVDFEVKTALSLKSFFVEVTEEQMCAYNTQVVGAVRNNDLELLKNLHGEGQALDCFNRFGESLLNMACRRGFESIAQYLMESGTVDVRICDDGGRTPLHDACWNPSPQLTICQSIIEREPALLLVADRRGCTAFQYARQEHWDEWRKFLFENRNCLSKLTNPVTLSMFAKS